MELSIIQSLVFLAFSLHLASAATHSLQYVYTAVTPGTDFPEFTSVGLLDREEFVYYDSVIRKRIPKMEWIKEVVDPDYWNRNTLIAQGSQETFKVDIDTLMKRFNQTGGIHTVQRMYGCELSDEGIPSGYDQFGYDGEDFISFDLKTLTWTAANQKAEITKRKWDLNVAFNHQNKNYYENTCIDWLKQYVGYGRSTLERKVPPKTDLFQKDSSSPVVCHATGFFPKSVIISWQKNGEDVHENVELRETLPNPDGSFQKRSILTVSPEELKGKEYTCVIQHAGMKEELRLSEPRVLSGGGSIGIIIGAAVAVLLVVVIACVGVFIWRKKSGFKPVSQQSLDGDSSSTNSK